MDSFSKPCHLETLTSAKSMSNFQIVAARSIIFEYDKLLTSFHLSGKGLKAALVLLDAKGSGSSKVNNGTS